jgi:hypothetical protein
LLFSSTPVRGGTGGGTLISITGMNFPNGQGLIVVTIAGVTCRIVKVLPDLIQCRTAPLTNNYYSSIRVPIVVFIQNQGFALNQVSRNFLFLFLVCSTVFVQGFIFKIYDMSASVLGYLQ